MKRVLLLLQACLALSLPLFSQSKSDSLPAEKIKILTWNIYMLPKFITNTGKIERAEKIGEKLMTTDYDVIVFQEAFHKGARRKIRKDLEESYPYHAGPANLKAVSIKTNSGIWIFSKYPITHSKSIIFSSRSGIDAFSRKGALLVEVNVNGQLIQVIGTHLQNSGGPWIRHSQCVEVYHKLMKPLKKQGVPQVICGDFNINKDSTEAYQMMLQTLNAEDGELEGNQKHSYDRKNNDLHAEKGFRQDLIDYILIRNNGGKADCSKRKITPIKNRWHKDFQDLSDHYPIEAEIRFSNILDLSILR